MKHSRNQAGAAATRLVTLALLADGEPSCFDFRMLERLRAFDLLGLSKEEFVRAADAYRGELRDAAAQADAPHHLNVETQRIRGLLAAIQDRARQRELACLIFGIVRADARIHAGESLLLWEALDAWKLRLADVVTDVAGNQGRRVELRTARVFRRRSVHKRSWLAPAGVPAHA